MARRKSRYESSWPRYVPVHERRAQAGKKVAALVKAGRTITPVAVQGRQIAKTFWGTAWCDNLEAYSDFSNRLPRGRTYVRNGSVVDLQIQPGQVRALVSGSQLYSVKITITALSALRWQRLKKACAGKIDSLVELLQGALSHGVMEMVTQPNNGLFPEPKDISLHCSCPDGASMCKHVAAALYGVGARLDSAPELLFTLRNVEANDLIAAAVAHTPSQSVARGTQVLANADLSDIFGIEMDSDAPMAKHSKAGVANGPVGKKVSAAKKAAPKQAKPAAKKAAPKKAKPAAKKAAPKKAKPAAKKAAPKQAKPAATKRA